MNPLRFVLFLVCCLLCVSPANAVDKPNVIIFYTDDQGTLDANCYGSTDLITPNIGSHDLYEGTTEVYLSNISDLEPEATNHADAQPEIVQRLTALHEEWAEDVFSVYGP